MTKKNKTKNKSSKKWLRKIKKSPINYFSDLFIIAVVMLFIIVSFAMIIMGTYSTIVNNDNSIWSELQSLTTAPITVGIGAWLGKCAFTHAIANAKGGYPKFDFPDDISDGEEDI